MSSTYKPSLPLRIATLTLAVGSLTALVVQASVSAGCNGSGATSIPSATPEPPPQQAQPPMGTPASAAVATPQAPPALKPGAEYLPSSKAAPVFHSEDVPKELAPLAPAQQKAPPPGANPALKSGTRLPASKSGFVFDPEPSPAPQAPAVQNNAAPQQGLQPQGTNR